MKFEKDLHITTKSNHEKECLINTIIGMGLVWFGLNDEFLSINVDHIGNDFMTVIDNDVWPDSEQLTFEQFMQKYGSNTMIEKIKQAKKQLNFNNKQLSEALGYSRQYITKMLNLPQSEKIQNKVENEIHALLNREKFDPLSILSKPSEQRKCKLNELADIVHKQYRSNDAKETEARLCNEIDMLKFEHGKQLSDIQKKLENKQIVINKLDDQLICAEKVHNEGVKALQEAHSIIHIKNQRIDELERDIDGNNFEIKELNQAYIEVCDAQKWNKDRIVCERWLFLIIIAILSTVVIFK